MLIASSILLESSFAYIADRPGRDKDKEARSCDDIITKRLRKSLAKQTESISCGPKALLSPCIDALKTTRAEWTSLKSAVLQLCDNLRESFYISMDGTTSGNGIRNPLLTGLKFLIEEGF
jgi:hypothetical protein